MQRHISTNLMKKQSHPNLRWPEDEHIFRKFSFLGELIRSGSLMFFFWTWCCLYHRFTCECDSVILHPDPALLTEHSDCMLHHVIDLIFLWDCGACSFFFIKINLLCVQMILSGVYWAFVWGFSLSCCVFFILTLISSLALLRWHPPVPHTPASCAYECVFNMYSCSFVCSCLYTKGIVCLEMNIYSLSCCSKLCAVISDCAARLKELFSDHSEHM